MDALLLKGQSTTAKSTTYYLFFLGHGLGGGGWTNYKDAALCLEVFHITRSTVYFFGDKCSFQCYIYFNYLKLIA